MALRRPQGGPARAFDRMMPAFGDELTEGQIGRVIDHIRTFCVERGWPRGDLNLPRPFVTEKAFPENEAVLTTTIVPSDERSLGNKFLYEHRVGRRGQYELFLPLDQYKSATNGWQVGVDDIASLQTCAVRQPAARLDSLAHGGNPRCARVRRGQRSAVGRAAASAGESQHTLARFKSTPSCGSR